MKSVKGFRWLPDAGSLRVGLTFLFALVTSAAIAILGLILEHSLSSQLDLREREQLAGKLAQFRHLLAEIPDRRRIAAERNRFDDALVGHSDMRAVVLDPSGAALAGMSAFAWPIDRARDVAAAPVSEEITKTQDGRYHVILAAVPVGPAAERVIVAIAHDRSETRLLLSRFRISILLACIVGSLIAGGMGYVAVVRGLAPVRKLAEAAKRISAERLGERLNMRAVPAELRELAGSFNDMLSRLDDSFQRLSQFSADLAHELRTPIANMMLHSQVALERPRSETELRAVLESGLEELERLSRMVNDMLFLAKADHAQIVLNREPVPVEEEVSTILEYFEPLAAERGIKLAREGTGRVDADRGMIRRLLANLVSNAVRYANPDSTVEVRLTRTPGALNIAVENAGAPLSEEECRRVFDRFYRGARQRFGTPDGAGLGLSIVKSIAVLHGGAVGARTADGHNSFTVTLPSTKM